MNEKDLQERYLEVLRDYSKIDKRMALMEQNLIVMKDNHLRHLENDVKSINRKFNFKNDFLYKCFKYGHSKFIR